MKNFLRITFAFLALALSATAYCSTSFDACKAEQACVTVSPPGVQLAQEPVVFAVIEPVPCVTCVPFVTFESRCEIVGTAYLSRPYQYDNKSTFCPFADIYLQSHRCVMYRRCELTASTGYKQHVKRLPYSRHVYTRC